jgi:NADH/F420H2 dehydrogenase subunit C
MTIQPSRQDLTAQRYEDRNATLARELAPIEQITGRKPVAYPIKGDLLNLEVERANLLPVCRFLRDQLGFDLLSSISGVDMLDHLEAVYHVRAISKKQVLQFRVRIDARNPEVESVVSIWPGANWLEREVYDLFGIRFLGHPDLRRILLDDDFEGYPLLKSFQAMPPVVKDPATTQVGPNMAIESRFQTEGYESAVVPRVGQGMEERLHPGTPTFGHTQESYQKHASREKAIPEGESAAHPEE